MSGRALTVLLTAALALPAAAAAQALPPTTVGRERMTNPFLVELIQRGGTWD